MQNRDSCPACRFKTSIAAGMDMRRGNHGKYTQDDLDDARKHNTCISNVYSLIEDAFSELSRDLSLEVINNTLTVKDDFLLKSKENIDLFYEKCCNIFEVNQSNDITSIQLNSTKSIDVLKSSRLLHIMYSNLFNLLPQVFNKLNNDFAEGFISVMGMVKYKFGTNGIPKQFKIVFYIIGCYLIDNENNDKAKTIFTDEFSNRLFDFIKSILLPLIHHVDGIKDLNKELSRMTILIYSYVSEMAMLINEFM